MLNESKTMDVTEPSPGKLLYAFWCPGCRHPHSFKVGDWPQSWTFDGNLESPTFGPSLLNTQTFTDPTRPTRVCHLFVRGGRIEFCGDSTHDHAGRTVPLPPFSWDIGDAAAA